MAGAVFLAYFARTYDVPMERLSMMRRGEIGALIAKMKRR